MAIDAFTVLVFGLVLKVVLAVLFLIFSFDGRRAYWFRWWSGTFLLTGLTTVIFMTRGFNGEFATIGIAVALIIAACACCWQGARVFERRRPLWWPVLAAPGLWLAACLVPGFVENVTYRVLLSSCLLSPLLALTAIEFWRGRDERLPSWLPVVALFASVALIFALRIPLIGVAPFPFGAQPAQPYWVAIFNFVPFFHTIVLAVLLVAMTKERLELEQRTQAQTDPLTGTLNRRAFMTRGRRLVLRHRKTRAPLCLLFLDLDHFKSLNDRFGHLSGDDVLKKFVAIVQDNIRPTDFLFRLGGEEFCCLLPYTGTEHAVGVAERIRRRWADMTLDMGGVPITATVSLGIASTEAFGYDLDALVRRADMAVYAAKRQGRNRVVVADAGDPTENGGDAPLGVAQIVATT
jgi:diguanylate cyclase (GGDEF)-like protein